MEFVVLYGGSKRFQFPVNPEIVNIRLGREYAEFEVQKLGQVAIPRGVRLSEIRFQSFFPRDYQPDYCEYVDIPDPAEAQWLIQSLMAGEEVIRFLITETWVNIPATIREFDREVRAGEPGDVYFDIVLKYHRPLKVRILPAGSTVAEVEKKSVSVAAVRPDLAPAPAEVRVVAGDSLYLLAKKHLGSGARWGEIYELNKKVIGPNPNLILVGQVLKLPKR